MNLEELQDPPFFCWECITLQLPHRDVDLVIRDQNQMNNFLKFLIHSMKTIDGKKNTATSILKTLNE